MNFQKIVLTIAIIMFIVLLVFVSSVMYSNKTDVAFPPIISECPDYWLDREITSDSIETSSGSNTVQKCYNIKNLGNPSCDKTMDFTTDFWQGSQGNCRKYKWAKGCDLTWDGITNNSDICDTSDDNTN